MDTEAKNTVLITCGPSLGPYLQNELDSLDYKATSSHRGGIEIEASIKDTMELNLRLRTAYNVLYLLKHFRCTEPDELYEQTYKIGWEDIIAADEYISIVANVNTATINNTMYPALKVKDAIVDRMVKYTNSRPNSGPDRNNIVINLFWSDDRCWLYLNTSGAKLSDRGYRKMPFMAPMRENLAAAVVMETGYDGTVPFANPMCGSGTLAIEAALIATNRQSGLLRSNYGLCHLKNFDSNKWQDIRTRMRKLTKKNPPKKIIATDIDAMAIEAARKNAMTAGVEHLIEFSICDFTETPIPADGGIVIMNPEYGKRLGEEKKLQATYKRIGDFFKQSCAGYTGYVFTGNLDLAKKLGLRTSKRAIFYNGNIECRLLKYELYSGTSPSNSRTDS